MDEEAKSLELKADQMKRKGFFASIFGGDTSDEMIGLYNMAANKYKLAHKWKEACSCIVKSANLYKKNREHAYCANAYLEAGTVAKKYDKLEAIKYIELAIEVYATLGRFSNCGKSERVIAEIFEDTCEFEEAAQRYKKAAYYFEMDEYSKSVYTQCITKYAELSAQYSSDYYEAIKIFESEAEKALKNNLLQYGARDYYMKAGILHLMAGDLVNAKISIEKYGFNDARFLNSREKKLLDDLIEAIEENNAEMFSEVIQEYDRITQLDKWKIYFFYKIKERMNVDSKVNLTEDGAVDLT